MVAFRFRMMDPWRELGQLRQEMNRMFESAIGRREIAHPPCNVWSGDDDILVTCELPGVAKDSVDISVIGDTLTISGERKADEKIDRPAYHRRERGTGAFSRTVQLPGRVDAEKVDASYEDGVLTLRLPKAAEERPRKIEIKTA